MDWNLGAFVTLGLSLVGAIVWIIRLEGKVKLLNESVNGAYGIHNVLQEIKEAGKLTNEKLSALTERFGQVENDLKHLIKDHDRNTSSCNHINAE
jgi:hypothetical protein